jgi:ferredoxin-NADP reductase
MFEIVFLGRTELAPGVWKFDFRPLRPIEFVPGQYSHLALRSVPHERARAFTWISHPTEPVLSFITRLDNPASEYKQALFALQPGDPCHIDEPMGDAVLPRLATTPLVFAAQGIALASYVSIFTECVQSDLPHPITLFWARRGEDNPLEKLIPGEVPNLTRHNILYPERLSANDILAHVEPTSLLYLSGSQVFVETLGAELEVAGLLRERIIYDYYEGYASL